MSPPVEPVPTLSCPLQSRSPSVPSSSRSDLPPVSGPPSESRPHPHSTASYRRPGREPVKVTDALASAYQPNHKQNTPVSFHRNSGLSKQFCSRWTGSVPLRQRLHVLSRLRLLSKGRVEDPDQSDHGFVNGELKNFFVLLFLRLSMVWGCTNHTEIGD